MKRSLFFKGFVVFSLVFSIFFAFSLSPYKNIEASAKMQEKQEQIQELLTKSEEYNEKFDDASQSDTQKLKVKTKELLSTNKISLKTDGKLDFSNFNVKTFDENKAVYLPIKYKNVKKELNVSYFVIVFDENENLAYYNETKIIGDDVDYTSEVEVYNDGILAKKEHLELEKEDFTVAPDNEKVANGNSLFLFFKPTKASAGFWSEFDKCLSSKGIAGWAITSMSIACGLACAGTLGAGCVPCLLGLGLATEGVVSYCVFKVRAG
ncbi:hypothetical protein [Rossellomorea sp. NRS-1567]|uniref:hypothetical protein n=1 Tax=Rossellomorea sp. NRS-1567 TaxID=3233901 RepID=UPI003D2C7DB1